MDTIVLVVIAVIAAALAGALGFVLGAQRVHSAHAGRQAEAGAALLRVAALERDAEALRAENSARVQEERTRADRRVAEVRQLGERAVADARREAEERREHERVEHARRLAEVREEADADVLAERRRAAERLEELKADQKRLADEFDALSRRALEANTKAFLQQAEERLKRSQREGAAELQKRQDAVQQLIEPIQKTLDTVKSEMTTAEKARLEAHAALAEQLQN
ncbi:MAG: hypothetical protein VYC96_00975, partial [Actinomycetota bacterium]|nr:hypothetical protein [Actinomycetota bacterium]